VIHTIVIREEDGLEYLDKQIKEWLEINKPKTEFENTKRCEVRKEKVVGNMHATTDKFLLFVDLEYQFSKPKRWALFAGQTYYPAGGWSDFRGWFDILPEADDFIKVLKEKGYYNWFQIVNIENGLLVKDIQGEW